MKLAPKEQLSKKVNIILDYFEDYRLEKNLTKAIKSKAEIINCNEDKQKWNNFKQILEVYRNKIDNNINWNNLKYEGFKNVSLSKIKVIQIDTLGITSLPP